ncbi:hypothetical protein N9515_09915 [Vicingaceae bacterium]|nr:hypothetical protein [Vicingaceae bacterium]
MGFFGFLKKESYVNRLVASYKIIYGCDDMTSINNLRRNYTKDELKSILETLKQIQKRGELDELTLIGENLFKE